MAYFSLMKTLTLILSASFLTLSMPGVSGCALSTAGLKKGDEQNFVRSLNDINAGRVIRARMNRADGFELGGVDVEVAQSIVVLSGNVPRKEDKIEAGRIALSAPYVTQVGNEIQLREKQGQLENIKDAMLNKSVRARLIATKAVKARNYSVEVHDGVVYLMGVARTSEELALAAHITRTTKGTKEVISYVKVAGDSASTHATGYTPSGASADAPDHSESAAPVYEAPQPVQLHRPSP